MLPQARWSVILNEAVMWYLKHRLDVVYWIANFNSISKQVNRSTYRRVVTTRHAAPTRSFMDNFAKR